jgi:hypothetical protein
MPDGVPIPFPKAGLSLLVEAEGKPPANTARCLNARPIDPLTLRHRGAQREGLTKFCGNSLDTISAASDGSFTGFVQELTEVVLDRPTVTYAEIAGSALDFVGVSTGGTDGSTAPQIKWSDRPTSHRAVRSVAVHPLTGDVYATVSTYEFARYNSDGVRLGTIVVPNVGSGELLYKIAIDAAGDVYIASGREDYGDGRISKYELGLDGEELSLAWQWQPGGEVRDVVVSADQRLFAIYNTQTVESYVAVLDSLNASAPRVSAEHQVPFPANQIDVNSRNEMFVACLRDIGRPVRTAAQNPNPCSGAPSGPCVANVTGLTPADEGFYQAAVQTDDAPLTGRGPAQWYRADNPLEVQNGSQPANDSRIFPWVGTKSRSTDPVNLALERGPGPIFRKNALCRQPAIEFKGDTILYTGDGRRGTPHPLFRHDVQAFNIVSIAFRPLSDEPMTLLSTGGRAARRLVVNVNAASGDTKAYGSIRYRCAANSSDNYLAADAVFTNDADGFCIVTLILPGIPATPTQGDAAKSFIMRVNGTVAQYGAELFGDGPDNDPPLIFIGGSHGQAIANGDPDPGYFNGQIFEIVTATFDPSNYSTLDDLIQQRHQQAETIEGYLAHKYQKFCLLPGSGYDRDGSGGSASGPSAHPYTTAPLSGVSVPSSPASGQGYIFDEWESPYGILTKLASNGERLWTEQGSGVGIGVKVSGSTVYSTGPLYETGDLSGGPSGGISPEDVTFRALKDNGDSVAETGSGTFAVGISDPDYIGNPLSNIQRMAVDRFGFVYIPMKTTDNTIAIFKFDSSGNQIWEKQVRNENGGGNYSRGLAIALDDIEFDFGGDGVESPRFLYLGCDSEDASLDTLYRLELVSATPRESSGRDRHVLAIAGGDVHRLYGPASWDEISGGSASCSGIVTDGTGALSADSKIVWAVPLFGAIYMTDGLEYKRYDPATETVFDWTPTSGGSMPLRARILETWRGRAVLARAEAEPQNIYFSAVADPRDWNLSPRTLKSTSAVNLNTAPRAGLIPDIVNCFIPYSDDLAVIGCDHSIYRLAGDPLLGGEVQTITTQIGMAFGRPWCMDDSGVIYFMSSMGSFYRMVPAPGALPEKISTNIDALSQGIDLSRFTCRMVWDSRLNGIRIRYTLINDPTGEIEPSGGSVSGGSGSGGSGSGGSGSGGSSSGGSGSGGSGSGGSASGGSSGVGGNGMIEISTFQSVPNACSACLSADWPNSLMYSQAGADNPIYGFFFHIPTQSWWLDRSTSRNLDPQAMFVLDGDEPEDRVILEGGLDGFVRYVDYSTFNDDGSAIDSFCWLGPITPRTGSSNVRLSNFQITTGLDTGVATTLDGYGAQDAAQVTPTEAVNLTGRNLIAAVQPGDNARARRKLRGRSVFLRIGNATLGQRWSMESLFADIDEAGRGRTGYD